MRALALVIVLTACRSDGGDDYLIIPGGDDTIIGPAPDAPTTEDATSDGGSTLEGRVCLISDPRALTTCATTGVGGLAVVIGTQSTLTTDSGAFSITSPEGSNLMWRVSGAGVVASVMPLSSTHLIPSFPIALYEDLLTTNGVILDTDEGSIFARILQAGAPLPGATVSASPSPTYATFYDGNSSLAWDQGATGAAGVAWIPGAEAGTTTLTVTPAVGNEATALAPVEQLAVTFVTIVVP